MGIMVYSLLWGNAGFISSTVILALWGLDPFTLKPSVFTLVRSIIIRFLGWKRRRAGVHACSTEAQTPRIRSRPWCVIKIS